MSDSDVAYGPLIPLVASEPSIRNIFEQNKKQSFFSKIPVEIRLLIYEYALCHAQIIWPKQVAPRSNKFSSWAPILDHIEYQGMEDRRKHPEVPPIIQLKKTCRQIFWELEQYQVFYKVNDFAFDHLSDFHAFLGSLTSAKRHALTTIKVRVEVDWIGVDTNEYWLDEPFWHLNEGPKRDSIITLLRDCKSLRNLVLNLGADILILWEDPTVGDVEHQTRGVLEAIEAIARGTASRETVAAEFLWQFPQFRLVLNLPYLSNFDQPWDDAWIRRDIRFNSERVFNIAFKPIRQSGADMSFESQYGWINEKTSYLESILEIDTILQQLKSTRLTTLPTMDELSKAYAETNLDIPGNMRIAAARARD
ncbi:hypothetical protein M434DRAFT_15180 [Hypoxylon sp. CO27-5]|nr:hypothetical protein M434DRAFT_15180 [Hypoxylon sp. CO27-5]